MIGAIIGDIVGSKYEFCNTTNEKFTLFGRGCSFTDDTICTIAIADGYMNMGGDYESALVKWCRRYPKPMGGYGGSFARWIFNPDRQPYNSYGNGSAMRISALVGLVGNNRTMLEEVAKSAKVTHNHEDGIKGAVVTALMARRFQDGIKHDAIEVASQYYGIPSYSIGSNPFNETCMNAVPVALSCLIASTSFEDAIRKAILVGGDSDTIGAITGTMAEAYYGVPSELRDVALRYLPDEMIKIVAQYERERCY